MNAETGDLAGGDSKGGISESGTIAPESTAEAVAMSATPCTGRLRGGSAGRIAGPADAGRKLRVKLTADEFAAVTSAAAASGVTVDQFIAEAVKAKIAPAVTAAANKALRETGLLAADAPFTEWEILLAADGSPFRVLKVFKETLRVSPWADGPDGKPGRAVTFSHTEARSMRRAGIPKALSVGDVLVWGDKPCRVTRLPSAEEMAQARREHPPMMTLAGDWLEAGELFDEEVPYSIGALHVRFLRFAMPAEREAFGRADKIREGRAFPSRGESLMMKKARHEDQPTHDGE